VRVLDSRTFFRSEQLRAFLRYICEAEFEGRAQQRVWTSHGAVSLGRHNTIVDVGDVCASEYGPESIESVTGVDGAQMQYSA